MPTKGKAAFTQNGFGQSHHVLNQNACLVMFAPGRCIAFVIAALIGHEDQTRITKGACDLFPCKPEFGKSVQEQNRRTEIVEWFALIGWAIVNEMKPDTVGEDEVRPKAGGKRVFHFAMIAFHARAVQRDLFQNPANLPLLGFKQVANVKDCAESV